VPMSADDVNFFFTMREQIKLYHWQTHSYARHKATDDMLSKLDELIDEYVEVYAGKYGRPRLTARNNTVKVSNLSEKSAARFIKNCAAHIAGPMSRTLKREDTDLANIRDEFLATLNQLAYLFTLH
jgi:hypothetical protein